VETGSVMKKRSALHALLRSGAVALVVCWSSEAHAYRPFDGTDADVARPGEFELEAGPAYAVGRGVDATLALPAFVLNQGIAPRVELVADARNELHLGPNGGAESSRLTDTDVQLKFLLRRGALQDAGGVSIAIELGPLLPTLGAEPTYGADANAIVSDRFGPLTLHLNVGSAMERDGNAALIESIIMEGPTSLRVRPVTELLVEHEFGGSAFYSVLVGSIWPATDDVVFDAGVRSGLLDGAANVEVRLGLTWTVPIWRMNQSE
jgi:hypothetical protein